MRQNENGEWLNDLDEPFDWFNPHEGEILGPYMCFIGNFGKWPRYQKLEFKDETILYIEFNGYADSDNDLELDDPNYEECYEFYFKILKIKNKSKECKWKKGQEIYLNYTNFPVKWDKLNEKELKEIGMQNEKK